MDVQFIDEVSSGSDTQKRMLGRIMPDNLQTTLGACTALIALYATLKVPSPCDPREQFRTLGRGDLPRAPLYD